MPIFLKLFSPQSPEQGLNKTSHHSKEPTRFRFLHFPVHLSGSSPPRFSFGSFVPASHVPDQAAPANAAPLSERLSLQDLRTHRRSHPHNDSKCCSSASPFLTERVLRVVRTALTTKRKNRSNPAAGSTPEKHSRRAIICRMLVLPGHTRASACRMTPLGLSERRGRFPKA